MRTSNSPNLFPDTIIVSRHTTFVGTVFLSAVLLSPALATAATIFESATLGPTGIPQGSVPATNVNTHVYTGVRFQLTQPVLTTKIGGHFVDRQNGNFFGAIVALDDEDDFPDSGDLSTADVLGHTELTFPVPSAEVFGDINLALEPGWYALVFGSGLFGASGDGAAPSNNLGIGAPDFIGYQTGFGWGSRLAGRRFAIKGTIVPEPTMLILVILAGLSLMAIRGYHR